VAQRVVRDEGASKLLAGLGPRVMWISIGGFVFFGVYEDCRVVLTRLGV
jgi:solute carrier family 25 (mitochondrial S-adenosylmethionine transporter), member 26